MNFLNSVELKKELKQKINSPYFDEWFNIVEPLLLCEELQKRKLFKHHKKSVWDHLISVSFKSYKYSLKFSCDSRVCAIGGLLHDFYPYAWQYSEELESFDSHYLDRLKKKESLFKKHGFTHAKEAYDNYLKYFKEFEDKKISNCIIRHMFPLNIIPPRYKESWIVTFADKVDSFKDTIYIFSAIIKRNNH